MNMTEETQKLAAAAIRHTLQTIIYDPRKFWLLGYGTATYEKLTEAHAAILGIPHEQVLKDAKPNPEKYAAYQKEKEEADRIIEDYREKNP
jgi:hypothetical protein